MVTHDIYATVGLYAADAPTFRISTVTSSLRRFPWAAMVPTVHRGCSLLQMSLQFRPQLPFYFSIGAFGLIS